MFERFTDRARKVVVHAQEHARDLNHDYIGTEHFLIGLLSEDGSMARQVLRSFDLEREHVVAGVEDIVGRGATRPVGHISFTPRAKKVLELSLREAVRLGNDYISTEHLLLGIAREGEGVAAQILTRRNVALGDLRQRVLEFLEGTATGTEGAAGPRIGKMEDFLAPTCPNCRAAIQETVAFKDLEIPEEDGDRRITMRFVFCEACGHTIKSMIVA